MFNDTHFLETQFQLHKIFPVFFALWPFLPNLLFWLCFLLLPLKCWCCLWPFAWLPFLLNLSTFLGDLNHLYSLNFTYVAKHFSPMLATLLTSYEILTTAFWQELHRHFNSACSIWTIYQKIIICQEFKLCPLPNNSIGLSILNHKHVLTVSLPLNLHHSPLALVLGNYGTLKFIFWSSSNHSPSWACLSTTHRKKSKMLSLANSYLANFILLLGSCHCPIIHFFIHLRNICSNYLMFILLHIMMNKAWSNNL